MLLIAFLCFAVLFVAWLLAPVDGKVGMATEPRDAKGVVPGDVRLQH